MKTRILLTTIGAAALTAITFNVNAGTTLLSPRDAGNQVKIAPGVMECHKMTTSPKAIQACAANPAGMSGCCKTAMANDTK